MISFGNDSSQDTNLSSLADSFPNSPWWGDISFDTNGLFSINDEATIKLIDNPYSLTPVVAKVVLPVTRLAKKALELLWFIPFDVKVASVEDAGRSSHLTLISSRGRAPEGTWHTLAETARTVLSVMLARQYEYLFVEEQALCQQYGVTELYTPGAYAERCLLEYGDLPTRNPLL